MIILFQQAAQAQMLLQMKAGSVPSAVAIQKALSIPAGAAMRIENFQINDNQPSVVNLDLRRIEIISPKTEIVVHSAKGRHTEKPPARAHFSGKLEGEKDSFVFLAVDEQGEIRSIIHRGNKIIVNELRPATHLRAENAVSRKVDHAIDFVDRDFSCGVDTQFITKTLSTELFQSIANNAIEKKSAAQNSIPQATQRRADIIVETDYEYYQKFGSTTAASNYVTDVFAYVSAKYEQEINTRFSLTQINIYSTAADPWAQTSSSNLLNELKAYWNDASRSATARHHVHLFSGKDTRGGIAYMNTLGSPTYAYGVSGGIVGDFSASNPQIVWDTVVVAHEIGHAFGSDHTHNFDAPAFGSSTGGAIDCCYSDDSTGQCGAQLGGASRYGILPGLGAITGGTSGQGNGTIMSYCHLLTPGMSNLRFTFGEGHLYGVNPDRVATLMKASAEQYLPIDTAATTYTLTAATAGTGTGTITSSPTGINCGSDCSESYAANTSVTLTATPATGSSFTSWSGSCIGATTACTMTMSAARSVTASFATTATATTRLINLTKSGTGTGTITSSPSGISCTTACSSASASFSTTASVALTATPATGSTFTGWSGSCTGSSSCTIAAGSSSASVGAAFTASSSGGTTVTPLNKTGLSGATGSSQSFTIAIPTGATNLVISTSGGTGDIDLYVKAGSAPTLLNYDCAPYLDGNTESCTAAAPTVGNYYILLDGASAYSGVALKATYTSSTSSGSGPLPIATDFVAQQYRDLLGREADTAGLNSWVSQLNAGTTSRAQMAQSLMDSDEFKNRNNPAVRLYTAYFLRQPDYTGLMYWIGRMFPASGTSATTLAQVSQAFAESTEFINRYGSLSNDSFVNLVYQNVLGRQPDAVGKAAWVSRLNAGMSRGELMIGFSESPENQGLTTNSVKITMGYIGFLRRTPSASEHAGWLAEVVAGRSTVLSFIDAILNSTEYASRF